ncbi:precorrin-2 C(20)-methyltransferase [Minwuia sp.]|uniref:precorrin-2 C(20)-methyltransferase n=1 Tax=Minwuia sp. TaxID=2493630 RepID=UPI003A9138F4
MTGRIIGVGVGPGDPDLMTRRAVRVIAGADAVFYLSADGKPSRALATAQDIIAIGTDRVAIEMPMRSNPEAGRAAYDRAAADIACRARDGQTVAVLCEGDPLLYGSFIYLLERLRPDFSSEVVPGIPSFVAASAAAVVPLVRRTESVSLLPGTLPEAELTARLGACECAAVLKTGSHLPKVRNALEKAGMAKDAVVVEEASAAAQTVTRLDGVSADRLPYFAIILAWRG